MESRLRAHVSSRNKNKIPNELKRPTSHLTIAENESWDDMWRQQKQNVTKKSNAPISSSFFFSSRDILLLPADYHNGLISKDL